MSIDGYYTHFRRSFSEYHGVQKQGRKKAEFLWRIRGNPGKIWIWFWGGLGTMFTVNFNKRIAQKAP